jgi:hypothetical protein
MGLTAAWATVAAAAAALVIGFGTIRQKWRTDQRDAWWKRTQWAIDKSLSANPVEREIGARAIGILVNQRLGVPNSDAALLQPAAERAFMDFRRDLSGT